MGVYNIIMPQLQMEYQISLFLNDLINNNTLMHCFIILIPGLLFLPFNFSPSLLTPPDMDEDIWIIGTVFSITLSSLHPDCLPKTALASRLEKKLQSHLTAPRTHLYTPSSFPHYSVAAESQTFQNIISHTRCFIHYYHTCSPYCRLPPSF